MQTGDQHAASARFLLAGTFRGTLSSHSLEHEGYPFGSVVPFVPDENGMPMMLLSHLAQHTRNIDARPQCAFTLVEAGHGDVQQLSRLSMVGDMTKTGAREGMQRYFNHFPRTRAYYDELGFRFYLFRPARFHWNAGFATARWFDPGRILRRNVFSAEIEQQILVRLNTDHLGDLSRCLLHHCRLDTDEGALVVGIDGEGMNLRADDRLFRIAFPRDVSTPEQARSVLVEMAAQID